MAVAGSGSQPKCSLMHRHLCMFTLSCLLIPSSNCPLVKLIAAGNFSLRAVCMRRQQGSGSSQLADGAPSSNTVVPSCLHAHLLHVGAVGDISNTPKYLIRHAAPVGGCILGPTAVKAALVQDPAAMLCWHANEPCQVDDRRESARLGCRCTATGTRAAWTM